MEVIKNKIAYAETYEFLELLGDDYKNKIPESYYNFIVDQKPKKYDIEKIRNNVANDELSEDALKLISIINMEFFIEDEVVKKAYKEILSYNKKEDYSIEIPKIDLNSIKNDVFEDKKIKRTQIIDKEQSMEIIPYKSKNIFSRFFEKIKALLKK